MEYNDRINELNCLNEQYASEDASFVVIYGRRRVGKTTLIRKFLEGKPCVYYLASEESELQNRIAFCQSAALSLHRPELASHSYERWESVFEDLVAKIEERLVIVLDEFQYLGKSNPAFPSIFQRIWDTNLMHQNVMVILCGSFVSMMESQTLSYNSPLYGRRTAQIKLRQISYRYYHDFFPDLEESERLKYYAVTGGIPKYIEMFKGKRDVFEAIEDFVLNKNGFLYEEPMFLLRHEVGEVGTYYSVLSAIASGNRKISQLASVLQLPQTHLPKYLHTLMELDLIERQVPVTESNPEKSKRGIYRIKDNFISFWFRFVYPYRSMLEMGNTQEVLRRIRRDFASAHLAYVYEDICKERLLMMSFEKKFCINFIGRWWDNYDHEIDIVGLDQETNTLIACECKCWIHQVGVNVLLELEEKTKFVNWRTENRKVLYVLFSVCGFTEELWHLSKTRNDLLLVEG